MQKTVCKPLTRRTLSFVDKLYGEKLFAYIYAHMCQSSGEEEKKRGISDESEFFEKQFLAL